ncbi:unnamed protein product [Bemisia tabaci]|uniref:Arginyl-tRNA--protein transferase 1 n=1 Tax=Bemisia tabaci TaxID=7038 RepID=A0A9P0CDD3_BEMTA|nr:PREDICTED: arginyl-tRNA--protein transferase 1 isoform X2 [Bemisia tabaci]CAH0775865.1 unnamed protein product [Bemisia tabaci]
MAPDLSIVEFHSDDRKYRCGYCKKTDSIIRHGMWAHQMSVEDYQCLIDRGWRRSGSYCYKPTMNETCCPMYTIKCAALEFRLAKSHKKILKQMHRFLATGDRKRSSIRDSSPGGAVELIQDIPQERRSQIETSSIQIDAGSPAEGSILHSKKTKLSESMKMETEESTKPKSLETKLAPSELSTRVCGKAKFKRRERKKQKLISQGMTPEEAEALMKENRLKKSQPKGVEDFVNAPMPENPAHRLEIKLVRTRSEEFEETFDVSWALYTKYQMAVHNDPPEECTRKSYSEFLVLSPLKFKLGNGSPPKGYGSFHQQYWLDGKLIAVGVLDILPKCVSSVYFFYDPDYKDLTLGTYGSLREVMFVRSLQAFSPSLRFYYMGYYIHSCPKMRYKANLSPSFLLCPETYEWFPIKECLAKLDQLESSQYCRFNPDLDATDTEGETDLGKVTVFYSSRVMSFTSYLRLAQLEDEPEEVEKIKEYAMLVGKKCANRMLLLRTNN